MSQKSVLLVDDEQGFLEALADALEHEGYRVLKARSAEAALQILKTERIDLATVDIMLSPGKGLENEITSQTAGVWLCEQISKQYPRLDLFCLSVVTDQTTIRKIESFGARFLRKGETPLRTVISMVGSRLTGIAYSTERPRRG